MPDYDLGRAHGKVVIDADTRGADRSDRALNSFARTVKRLEVTLNRFERNLNQLERNLNSVAREAKKTDRSLDDLDGSVDNVHRTTKRTSKTVRDFDVDLDRLTRTALRAYRVFDTLWRPIDHVRTALARFNDADSFRGYLAATNHTVMFTRALRALGGQIIGVNKAYDTLSPRQSAFIKNAAKLTGIVAGFKVAETVVPAFGRLASKMGTVQKAGQKLGDTIQMLNNYAINGEGRAQKYAQSIMRVAFGMDNASVSAKGLYRELRNVSNAFDGAGRKATQAIIGFKIFQNSIEGLKRGFGGISLKGLDGDVKLVLGGIATAISVLGPLSEVAAKGLVVLSNGFNLLLNAATQLAGGLLTLPGLYGSIAAAIVPAVFALKGISDQFKGITGTAAEFYEAMDKMPAHLRPLGSALRKLSEDVKDLQKPLQEKLLIGLERDVDALRSNYVPAIRKSFDGVIGAYNEVRNRTGDFLFSDKTVTDFNRGFITIEGTIRNLSRAIEPFFNGMRDLTIVGMQFFRDWSAGAEGLATRFEEWVAAGRRTGELRKYMDDALEGAKDLVRGIVDLTKALWSLLTLFATDNGDNALDRFATSMEKFNNAVNNSKANGFLKEFSDRVKGLGFAKFNELKATLQELRAPIEQLLDALIPFVQGISAGFKDTFIPMIKVATQLLESFINLFDGLEPAIGWILGIAAGFKLIAAVANPIMNVGKAVAGLAVAAKGLQGVLYSSAMINFVGIFDKILPKVKKVDKATGEVVSTMGMASTVFDKLDNSVGKAGRALSRFAIGIGVVGATAAGLWYFFTEGDRKIDSFNSTLEDSKAKFAEWKNALNNAFKSDNGLVGKNVFDEVSNGITQMRADLDAQAKEVPDIWDNITASFDPSRQDDRGKGFFDQRNPFFQGKEFNDMQKATQDAERAKKKFDELGLGSQDLAGIITGGDSAFKEFAQTLRDSGENGNEAAAKLEEYRATFQAMQADFAKAGPGSVMLSEGIKKLGDAGGDATTKLEGLKQALQGLGLLQTSAMEDAFAYAEAVREIGNEAEAAVNKEASLTDILNANGDGFNYASVNGKNLFGVLSGLADKFLALSANGGNVNQMWSDLQPQIKGIADAFQLSEEKVTGLLAQMGVVPNVIDILLNVKGGDKVMQDLAAIAAKIETGAKEIVIPITGDKTLLEQSLKDLGIGATVGDNIVTINGAEVSPEALNQLREKLGAAGVQAPGAPPPPKPATVPVAPQTEGDRQRARRGTAPAAAPVAPQVAPPPQDTAKLDEANNKVKELEATIKSLNEQKANVEVSVDKVSETETKISELKTKLEELKTNVEFTIIAKGYDETVAVVSRVKDSVTQLLTEAGKIATTFQTAFQQAIGHANAFVTQFQTVMQNLASTAQAQGTAFVNALAAGIRDNPAAIQAAEELAKQIRERFHQSPPKKGPLSAHGDAAKYAGSEFVNAYAAGVGGNPAAANAANSMAGGVAGQAAQGPYELGKLLGAFKDIFDFGRKIFDAFMQITDVMFQAAKLISDPMNEGKFFGQKLYGRDRNVSDRQLERNREDALQSKIQSATEKGSREGVNGAYESDRALLANVPAGKYQQAQNNDLTKGLADCSSAVEDLVNIMDGRPTGGRQMSTFNAAEWLTAHGFVQGEGGPGDFRVAFNSGHMQATLPGGTPFNWGSDAAAARGGVGGTGADDPALTERYYRPVAEALRDASDDGTASAVEEAAKGLFPREPDLTELTDVERQQLQSGQYSALTQEEMLKSLRSQDSSLDQALSVLQDGNATNEDIYKQLPVLDQAIEQQNALDTPTSRQNAGALESIRGDTMSQRGIVEQDPIGMVQDIAGSAANVAQSVFSAIESGFEAASATAQIGDMLVRGVENSEDVMKLIDNFQSYLTLAANIASAVGSGLNAAASLAAVAGADPSGGGAAASGALSAAGQIAQLISAGISTVNGIIDLAQEAYSIAGKYVGEFLGFLTGGMGGQLMGDVKFLLDEVDGTLKTWSKDNPEDKRTFDNPFTRPQQDQAPRIGEINVFPERGADPAQITNEMMFAVSAASSGAWSD